MRRRHGICHERDTCGPGAGSSTGAVVGADLSDVDIRV